MENRIKKGHCGGLGFITDPEKFKAALLEELEAKYNSGRMSIGTYKGLLYRISLESTGD